MDGTLHSYGILASDYFNNRAGLDACIFGCFSARCRANHWHNHDRYAVFVPSIFPVIAMPLKYRPWLMANPLTFIIEQAREVLIWGRMPDWIGLGIYMLIAIVIGWLGFALFQKTRKGFADVI